MKISCTQENLNQGLFVVSHLAAKSASLPILNNILFQVDKNTIKLSATNLEIGVSCVVRGKVEEPGDFTVQSRLLADYMSLLPKERVDLVSPNQVGEGQDQILEVKCKNYATKIKGQPAVDFPVIPQIEKKQAYVLKPEDFRQAVSQVIFAVSANETRPEINGISFNFKGDKLILATTDSYRLAEKTITLGGKPELGDKRVIVPTRTMQELLRILSSFKDPAAISNIEEVKIYISENQILFTLDSIELISRLVEGQYPDYQQIIPSESKTKVVLDVMELTKATKTASLFTRSGIYDVSLEFVAGKKEVVISSTNSQLGENTSNIGGEFSGEDNRIVVNYRYLLDGLQNINSDQVEVSIIDGNNPCVLRPVGKKSDYLYIIMPIKQ